VAEVVVLLGAEIQTQEFFAAYEDSREGKGVEFLATIEAAFDVLREFPEAAPHYAHGYRRWVLVKYQKGIFYRVEGQRVMVADVLDLRQNPEVIRQRFH
jgi:plasmid stabilization system protein ParE